MSDANGTPVAPSTDRHDRVTARLDALEAAHRAGLEQVRALRQEVDALTTSQEDGAREVAEVRAELKVMAAGQSALAAQLGGMQAQVSTLVGLIGDDKRGLVAQVQALAARVPSGAAVATLGAGGGALGLGSMLSIAYAAAQALGWIGAQ